MAEIRLEELVKIYPYTKTTGFLLGKRKAQERLEAERRKPYTTNEGVIAVQHFSLDIKDGEFIVLLGPSGCGKSTVLNMIAGVSAVSAGAVYLNGEDITEYKPEDRNMAMIFQTYALYPHLTVYDNIAYPLQSHHVPAHIVDEKVMKVAELLKLTKLLKNRPAELSGGEQQRVAIGRALVRDPEVFLMDEPLSNLDASLRTKMRDEMARIHRELGMTFIYVTHDQREAFALGNRIVVMRDGIIQQVGTPKELYNHPANLYTAGFVGTPAINVTKTEILQEDGRWKLSFYGKNIPLPEGFEENMEGEDIQKVYAAIRPVHVKKAGPGDEVWEASVIYKELLGSEVNLGVSVNGEELRVVLPVNRPEDAFFAPGDKLKLTFPAEDILLFDLETEEAWGCTK